MVLVALLRALVQYNTRTGGGAGERYSYSIIHLLVSRAIRVRVELLDADAKLSAPGSEVVG